MWIYKVFAKNPLANVKRDWGLEGFTHFDPYKVPRGGKVSGILFCTKTADLARLCPPHPSACPRSA